MKLKTLIFFTLIATTINAQTYENKGGGIYIANENGIIYTKQENTSGLKSMVGFVLDSVSIKVVLSCVSWLLCCYCNNQGVSSCNLALERL